MNTKLRIGTPEEAGMSASRLKHVVELAHGWVEEGFHPALVILAARRGVVVIQEAFGQLTPDKDSPAVKVDTLFPVASISKPITATAAMILAEEGLLGLNRPVIEYIPEFKGEGKDQIMVHHLLTHTSGLTDEDVEANVEQKITDGGGEVPPPDETQHPEVHQHLFLGYDTPLTLPPGEEQRYCSFGIGLVGEIVRRVSGMSLDEFTRARLFEPLGMDDTSFIVPDEAIHRAVKRPADNPLVWIDSLEFQKTPWSHGGAFSTAKDMAIFGQMFLNQGAYGDTRILSPITVAEMTRNQIPGIASRLEDEYFPEAGMGYTWFVRENKKVIAYGELLQSAQTFCHGGGGGTFIWIDPVYEIVGCYFSVDAGPEQFRYDEIYRYWRVDLFINALMASIVDA